MRKFDPWPIFFRREWNRNWPFLVGFAITGTIITKMSLGLTEEDAKNSPFVQRHKKYGRGLFVYLLSDGVKAKGFENIQYPVQLGMSWMPIAE
ncbi:hypothetical protein Acr_24g0010830 [Actinidia rufa]|uniref:Uncharacterized protein n=1 Tax=Actinidia rufa TaxID=165716 RepID=A0A7J0GVS0_9ERIC|nr:hypothetical protein Acr_24g0010830 [Actinidia rufa]